MNHLSARLLATLMASSLLAAGQARADFMNWSYSTTIVPPGFAAKPADGNGGGNVQTTSYTDTAGSSSINVLATQTTATAPVTFNAADTGYTLTMTIKDLATGHTGDLTFTGSISGGLSTTSSSLVASFTNPTQSLTLDGHTFKVTLPSTANIMSPTSPQQNIVAAVSVTDGQGGNPGDGGNPTPGGSNTPEPASLVLGSLGFSLFGVGSWWKRRRQAA